MTLITKSESPALSKAPQPSTAAWPSFDEEMVEAAAEVLRSGKVNYWTGPHGRAFEREFAEACGVRHAVAVSNGTTALETALYALGIEQGDEVIVPSRTFIATASSVVMRGATPVVADVDAVSQNLTAETVAERITPRTKAVIAVHLAGWPCEMEPLRQLANRHGIRLIEDCAQSHGARYRDRPVGSLGEIAAFSFCQDKILSTGGEGGMVVTNDSALWKRAWSYKDHGKSYDAAHAPPAGFDFRWVHDAFGTNARLTEVQSAIGRIALRRLPEWVATRRRYAALLDQQLRGVTTARIAVPPAHLQHSYYRYYVFLRRERMRPGWTRETMMRRLHEQGVPCFTGSCSEIYLERAFDTTGRPAERLPVAQDLGDTSLAFLVHPTLSEAEVRRTAVVISSVLRQAEAPPNCCYAA